MRRLTLLLALLVGFSLAIPAGATTTRIDFEATGNTMTGDAERSWLAGTIEHIRSQPVEGEFIFDPAVDGLPNTGDLHGSINVNFDTRTFDGRVWGEGTLEFDDGGFELKFAGDVGLDGFALVADYRGVGHGYGVYEGMQMRLTAHELIGFPGNPNTTEYDGELFIPADL